MAAIADANITYAQQPGSTYARGVGTKRIFTLSFGDAALTYPTGGLPLSKTRFGMPLNVNFLSVVGYTPETGNNNPRWVWNGSNSSPTIIGYETNTAGSPAAEVDAAYAPPATVLTVEVEGF